MLNIRRLLHCYSQIRFIQCATTVAARQTLCLWVARFRAALAHLRVTLATKQGDGCIFIDNKIFGGAVRNIGVALVFVAHNIAFGF